jgi:hypothetical protein
MLIPVKEGTDEIANDRRGRVDAKGLWKLL